MQRWKNITFNIALSLNCLLLFLLVFANKIVVPEWLQVFGRMHPLLLHFPIVLLLIYLTWTAWISKYPAFKNIDSSISDWLLLVTIIAAAITAIMGMLLSKESGYESDAISWHKWSGTLVAFLTFGWYIFRRSIASKKIYYGIAAIISFLLIMITGHQGAAITHGEDFLLAPFIHDAAKPKPALENAQVFNDMVKPILDAKCVSCHNGKKAKGGLVMENEDELVKGGQHGKLWEKADPAMSLLLKRIHLPADEKHHMPPAGKPQLTDEESQILFQWIKTGADFKVKVASLPATDTLRTMAANIFKSGVEEVYDFDPADDKKIEQLSNTNRVIHPIAMESPALAVNFYNRQNFTSALLSELLPLKEQIISLDLAYMPLKAEDINVISQFNNLRRLNLNSSTVPGASLTALSKLPKLKQISLSGTSVKLSDIEGLTNFPKLNAVYLWNAGIAGKELDPLRKKYPTIKFETGVVNDNMVLKLNPPIIENEERIINGKPIAIKLKHFIKGVAIRYTLDGTNPDSTQSALYKDSIIINNATVFKAKAFKPGWLASDSVSTSFFKNSFRADSIRSLTPLDSVYKGSLGAKTLINGEKGGFGFGDGKWLGFRRNRMEMLLRYAQPVTISSVSLSALVDIGGYIMPPAYMEVWGGANENSLHRLARIVPNQPQKVVPGFMQGFDCVFKPATVSYIKVIAMPVGALPAWHPAKGQKGWIFTDEIFVN